MKTNNKNVVRLTKSQLKAMVAESVREVLSELDYNFPKECKFYDFLHEIWKGTYDSYILYDRENFIKKGIEACEKNGWDSEELLRIIEETRKEIISELFGES